MVNIDELMKKATYDQRKVLSRLKGFVTQEKKLIEETKKTSDKENSRRYNYPSFEPDDVFRPMTDKQAEEHLRSYSSSTRKRLEEIQGKIKRTIEEAAKSGVLVVPYDNLK